MSARIPKAFVFSAIAFAVVVGAAVGAGTYAIVGGSKTTTKIVERNAAPQSTAALTTQQQGNLSVNQVYKQAGPGVVEITVTSQGQSQLPFGGSQSQTAQGSGFVYDTQGDIVTDQHVVAGAQSVSVKFQNGASYKATVVGSDASTDLAVIRVSGAPQSLLHPLALGDSSGVQVGDGVVAIGSPFGLENTVTTGIVSALHRDITAPNNYTITDTIQTDAAINHGNSGGVLLNLSGEVVGVTAQIDSESGGNDGVGFAIPSNTVKSIVSQLVSTGSVEHAYLGVHIQTIPADAASSLGVPAGVAVKDVVAGSPASKAGLKGSTGTTVVNGQQYVTGGDVITAMNGKPVATDEALQNAVSALKPGTQITLTVSHGGSQRTVHVTLGRRPS